MIMIFNSNALNYGSKLFTAYNVYLRIFRKTYSKKKYSSTSTLLKHLRSEHGTIFKSTEVRDPTRLDSYLTNGRFGAQVPQVSKNIE